MPLSDTKIKTAKAKDKTYKLYDAQGLYLEVTSKGAKRWRFRYMWEGKEKLVSLGLYPEVSLKRARELRGELREKIAEGVNPSDERRKAEGIKAAEAITFRVVAEDYYGRHVSVWSPGHAETVRRRLELYLYPILADRAMTAIAPMDVLKLIRGIEACGHNETAMRVYGIASTIFRFAVASGFILSDPCRDLRGAFAPVRHKAMAAITDKAEAALLMRAIETYQGTFIVRAAIQFTAITFVRQNEVRFAKWDEISWDDKLWIIPAERMKARREHIVPLSHQSMEILRQVRRVNFDKEYIFVSRRRGGPISEATVLRALEKMGFKDRMTAHGFRAMASTFLNEEGSWRPDVIERQLAHIEGNAVRAAYNRAEYLTERIAMMQWYADFLDGLKDGTYQSQSKL